MQRHVLCITKTPCFPPKQRKKTVSASNVICMTEDLSLIEEHSCGSDNIYSSRGSFVQSFYCLQQGRAIMVFNKQNKNMISKKKLFFLICLCQWGNWVHFTTSMHSLLLFFYSFDVFRIIEYVLRARRYLYLRLLPQHFTGSGACTWNILLWNVFSGFFHKSVCIHFFQRFNWCAPKVPIYQNCHFKSSHLYL